MVIKVSILIVFFAIMVGIGIYCRKHATDVKGFVLGGRSVGPWLTAFAYGTSYFSAVVFVGYAGQFGWRFGIASTWIGLGNAVIGSLLAWVVLGRRTRIMTQHLDSSTMPEFFGRRFDSKSLKIGASALIFVFLIPYTASLYNGLSRLFAMAFNVDFTVCIIGMAVLTGIYVIAGGYMATAINDFIQGIIMIFGICAVIAAVLQSKCGFMEAMSSLAEVEDAEVTSMNGAFASFLGPDPLGLLGVVVLTSLGTWGLPQMVQKFYAISSESAIHKGTIISTLFAVIVSGGCYFLGGFGRLFSDSINIEADGYDAIIPTMLSSLVMASSSTLTLDFIKDIFAKDISEKAQVKCIRVLIVIFIAISVVIALIQYKGAVTFIAQLMGISWGALAGAFLGPMIYGLYWKKTTKAACWTSFICGAGIMIAVILVPQIFPSFLQSSINAGAFAMAVSLVIVPVVSLFTKKPSERLTEDCFRCYDIPATVKSKIALPDDEEEI